MCLSLLMFLKVSPAEVGKQSLRAVYWLKSAVSSTEFRSPASVYLSPGLFFIDQQPQLCFVFALFVHVSLPLLSHTSLLTPTSAGI